MDVKVTTNWRVFIVSSLNIVRPQFFTIFLVALNKISGDYEYWNCQTCQKTNGYTYCRWADQFNSDGGCLPNVDDGEHTHCGSDDEDIIVDTCPGKS